MSMLKLKLMSPVDSSISKLTTTGEVELGERVAAKVSEAASESQGSQPTRKWAREVEYLNMPRLTASDRYGTITLLKDAKDSTAN